MSRSVARIMAALALCLVAFVLASTTAFVRTASAATLSADVQKIADPDTSSSWQGLFDIQSSSEADRSYSTQESGRIWVDKSVYADASAAAEAGIPEAPMVDADNDFIVGLSTLSASSTVRRETPYSHDVVFVVSLNSAMASLNYDGQPYAAHMAEALNDAIARLMAENDGATGAAAKARVAVVGYSVDVTVLMPLDSYRPDENGDYVVFSDDLGGGSGLVPVGTPDTAGVATASEMMRGSAYLQRAIADAADILRAGATDASADSPRKPELVVMGASVPLMANTDIVDPPVYLNETAEEDGFVGSMPANHNAVGFGTDAALATLLTLQNERRSVNEAYAAANGAAGTGADLDVWTVGLDTSGMAAYVLQTASGQASADVTETVGTTTVDLTDNIERAREAYAQAAAARDPSVELDLFGTGTGGIKSETLVFPQPVDGLLSADDGYAFDGASAYYLATDAGALSGGFDAAVDRILGIRYNSPVNEGEGTARDSSDRLRIQDDIGDAMNVKRVDGILYQGRLLDGSLAAQAVSASFADPWDVESYHEVGCIMDSLNARYDLGWDAYTLLYEAYGDGQFAYRGAGDYSNYVSWFTDDAHAMVKTGSAGYTFASSAVIAAAESGDWRENATDAARTSIEQAMAAGATAVCQTYFYIGNIEDQYTGDDVPLYDFVVMVETDLETGDQQLLLTIPADSIPARKAYVTEHLDGSVTMTLDADAESTVPLRLVYEVGPRESVIALADRIEAGEEVSAAEIEAALGDGTARGAAGQYLLYTNGFTGTGASATAGTVMSAVAASTNAYYSFTSDTPLYTLKDGESAPADGAPAESQLEPLTTAPEAGGTYYYLDTYYRAEGLEFGVEVPAEAVTVVASYTVPQDLSGHGGDYFAAGDGQYVVRAGTPKYLVSSMLVDYTKDPNATASAPYVKQIEVSDCSSLGQPLITARLGNNGTYALFPTQRTGSLTVEKLLAPQSGNLPLLASDSERPFDFEVALSDESGRALSGTVALSLDGEASELVTLEEGGIVRLSLKDGQSATFEGLAAGTRYTVTEAADDGFEASFAITENGEETASGTAAGTGEQTVAEGSSVVSFTNTKQGGSLVVSKAVAGNAADPSEAFPFKIALTDSDGDPLTGEFAYGLFEGTDPANGDAWSLGTATAGEDGVLTLESGAPALADGQSLAIYGLPVGSGYAVSETAGDGYTASVSKTVTVADGQTSSADAEGTIGESGQIDALTFTNEKWAYGSLQLTKRAYGADEGTAFVFSVILTDAQGEPLSGTYQVTVDDGADSTSSERQTDETGALSVSLTDGQTAVVEGIPQGTRYRIEETGTEDRYLVLSDGAEGVIGEDVARASFTNVEQAGALAVVNVIGGNAGDPDTTCTYDLTVGGVFADGTSGPRELQAKLYDSTGASTSMTVTFEHVPGTTEGVAVIDGLKGGEAVLIEGLPTGAPFTVTESNAGALTSDDYTVSSGIGSALAEGATVSGKLDPDAITVASFLNVKDEYGALVVGKRIAGNAALDEAAQGRSFTFTVHASDRLGAPLSGSFKTIDDAGERVPVLFENGTATVSLAAPTSAADTSTLTIAGLPAGSAYRVVEQDLSAAGYESSSTGSEGTIGNDPANPSEAIFTNEKGYTPLSMPIGGLEVLKGSSSEAGDFVFQLFERDGATPVLDADGREISSTNRAAAAGVPVSFILRGLTIDEPGDYSYVVRESYPDGTGPLAGVTYDETAFTVNISVKASATGKLSLASLSYSVGSEPVFGISFVNEYRTATGSFTLRVRKELAGAALTDGEFAFWAQEVDPDTLEPLSAPLVARNDSDGTVTFPSLASTAPQGGSVTRTFVISESLPPSATADNGYTAAGTTYDTAQYLVTVTGGSQGGSSDLAFSSTVSRRTLDASGTYGSWQQVEGADALVDGGSAPVFSNTHATAPTSATIEGCVLYRDETGARPLEDGMFRFSLKAVGDNSASAPLPDETVVTNTGESFSFGPIDIAYDSDLVGQTFTYEVRQVIPDGARYSDDGQTAALDGMTYDARVQTVSVEIVSRTAADGSRYLEAVVTYPDVDGAPAGAVEFRNAYDDGSVPSVPSDGGAGVGQDTGAGPGADGLAPTGDAVSPRALAAAVAAAALMVAIPLVWTLRGRRR